MMRGRGGNRNAPPRRIGHGNAASRPIANLPQVSSSPMPNSAAGAAAALQGTASLLPPSLGVRQLGGQMGAVGTPPAGSPTPIGGAQVGQMPNFSAMPTMSGPIGSMGTPPAGPVNMGGMGGIPPNAGSGFKKGGKVKAKSSSYKSGGSVKASSASKRGDGCAIKGKTKGRMV